MKGHLYDEATTNFGGIMRAINSTNFEQSNVEYIQLWVLDPYNNVVQNGGVNLEELIFTTIQDTPGINAPAIADTLKKSLRTTQRYLKRLSDAGRIEFRGATKNGGYYIL